MPNLKCKAHGMRIYTNGLTTIHTKNGTRCNSSLITLKDWEGTPAKFYFGFELGDRNWENDVLA